MLVKEMLYYEYLNEVILFSIASKIGHALNGKNCSQREQIVSLKSSPYVK